ncbi:MAG: hypothetical protein FWG78_00655 [Coriobacteriia bacterium]|nr:hypothetical protein [Coriobacteriia bacterium]
MTPDTFGTVIDELWTTIQSRKADAKTDTKTDASACIDAPDTYFRQSYTVDLLTATPDKVLKKVAEEAAEVALAAKDCDAARAAGTPGTTEHGTAHEHLVYETCDVLYHLLVMCARYDIELDELAAELKRRFANTQDVT